MINREYLIEKNDNLKSNRRVGLSGVHGLKLLKF